LLTLLYYLVKSFCYDYFWRRLLNFRHIIYIFLFMLNFFYLDLLRFYLFWFNCLLRWLLFILLIRFLLQLRLIFNWKWILIIVLYLNYLFKTKLVLIFFDFIFFIKYCLFYRFFFYLLDDFHWNILLILILINFFCLNFIYFYILDYFIVFFMFRYLNLTQNIFCNSQNEFINIFITLFLKNNLILIDVFVLYSYLLHHFFENYHFFSTES
jgi:hypothetical protein